MLTQPLGAPAKGIRLPPVPAIEHCYCSSFLHCCCRKYLDAHHKTAFHPRAYRPVKTSVGSSVARLRVMATVGRPTPPIIVSASEQGLIAQAVLCAVAGPAQISSSSLLTSPQARRRCRCRDTLSSWRDRHCHICNPPSLFIPTYPSMISMATGRLITYPS